MIVKHKCRNSWDIKSISFETFDRKKACSDDYIWLCTVCWFQNQVKIHNLWTYHMICYNKLCVVVVDIRFRSESSSTLLQHKFSLTISTISIPGVDFWLRFSKYEVFNWNANFVLFSDENKIRSISLFLR